MHSLLLVVRVVVVRVVVVVGVVVDVVVVVVLVVVVVVVVAVVVVDLVVAFLECLQVSSFSHSVLQQSTSNDMARPIIKGAPCSSSEPRLMLSNVFQDEIPRWQTWPK